MNNSITPLRILPATPLRIVPAEVETAARPAGEAEFLDTLRGAMEQVQRLEGEAQQKVAALLEGNGMDVHRALIAVEKADLSFQLMMQVRNKIVQAYQEIARLQF